MAITYDAGSNTITVTGYTEGTPCTFTDIWNADQAGGWGVVTKQGTAQFMFDCKLIIGDGSTETWFADTKKQVVFNDGVLTANYDKFILRTAYANIRFGTLIDATEKTTKDGCSLINLDNSYSYSYFIYDDSSTGQTVIYASHFVGSKDRQQRVIYGRNADIYETVCSGVFPYSTSGYNINCYRVTVQYGKYGIFMPTGTQNDILLHTCDRAIWWSSSYGGDVENVKVRNSNYQEIQLDGITKDHNIINPDFDQWRFLWGGTCTGKVYRQYKFDLTLTDKVDTPIQGATVTLKDKDGNTVFTETTDVDGRIPTQTVSRGYYDQAHGDTLQEYSPHTLIISKATYITYSTIFTFDKYLDWRIALLPQLTGDADPSDVKMGKTFYKDDVDTKLTGTFNPVTGGGIPYTKKVKEPTELEEPLLMACSALLIENKQLKKRRIMETLT